MANPLDQPIPNWTINPLDPYDRWNVRPLYLGPVGSSYVGGDTALTMPSTDVSPVVGNLGGFPVTAAANADAYRLASNMLAFGPADVGAIKAFHGSPYAFDRFDTAKIGTGEGAQAYGHGLYFAENEGVARGYRDKLAPSGRDYVKPSADVIAKYQDQWNDAVTKARAGRSPDGRTTPESDAAAAQLDALHSKMVDETIANDPSVLNRGKMYEVALHADPEHFLDWDKPLHQQSPHVQEVLSQLLGEDVSNVPTSPFTGRPLTGPFNKGSAYENVVAKYGLRREGADIKAAEALRDAGIPGIKYFDAGSRSAGEGSRNYVTFSDDIIQILRRYGIAGLLGGTAAAGAASDQQ